MDATTYYYQARLRELKHSVTGKLVLKSVDTLAETLSFLRNNVLSRNREENRPKIEIDAS